MECVRCREADHWTGAVYCHRCGTRLQNLCTNEACPASEMERRFRHCPHCGEPTLFADEGLLEAESLEGREPSQSRRVLFVAAPGMEEAVGGDDEAEGGTNGRDGGSERSGKDGPPFFRDPADGKAPM